MSAPDAVPRAWARKNLTAVTATLALTLTGSSPVSHERQAPRVAETTLGVLRLGLTPHGRALIRGATMLQGSDVNEIVFAVGLCRAEPAGPLCEEQPFVFEFSEAPVTVDDFLIDKLEVSVGEYRRCAEVGPCRALPLAAGGARFDQPDLPATMVSYHDATTFCRWKGGRLPTEAEWELAARGPARRRYPWGNVYDPFRLNGGRMGVLLDVFEDKDGFLELAPVGSFPDGKTAEGVHDLAGNAEEWVADWFDEYPQSPRANPIGPSGGEHRVVRGGSCASGQVWARSAARDHAPPGERHAYRGFRCAWDVP